MMGTPHLHRTALGSPCLLHGTLRTFYLALSSLDPDQILSMITPSQTPNYT